jgi:hypothetical protein
MMFENRLNFRTLSPIRSMKMQLSEFKFSVLIALALSIAVGIINLVINSQSVASWLPLLVACGPSFICLLSDHATERK